MNTEQFDRLNTLSEKSINNTATPSELEEFMSLIALWNESTEFNILKDTIIFDSIN